MLGPIKQFIQEWHLHCMGPIIVIYIIYANIVWAYSRVYMQSTFALHGPIMYLYINCTPIMPGPIILLYTDYPLVMNEPIKQFIQEWCLHCMGPYLNYI